jgi:DNA polymerase-1
VPYIDIEGELPTGLTAFQTYQVYNCLDSAITAQLLPVMLERLNANHLATYRRARRVLALCLEMSTKGLPVDQLPLAELLYQLEKDERKALRRLHQFCEAVDARPINPRSTVDVPWLFYSHLGLPPVYEYDRKTKTRRLTSDIKALEKLRANYPIAIPLVNAILAVREAGKMASVFKRGLEPRQSTLRCNVSPSGTETGRLSSQQNPYGRGTNAQNLTDRVRQAIAAPDGYALLNLDLKTAESIAVGFVSGCRAYIEACLTGDVHTAASRLNWPEVAWTGDIVADKKLAEEPYYRWFSRRDIMKKGGHGTNYYGKPLTIAKVALSDQVPVSVVERFQYDYFQAFPEIPEWHLETIARIQRDGVIVTQLGRERRFWGRPDDSATHREAIAYEPQSLVADVMNEGLVRGQQWVLKHLPTRNRLIADLRMQVHDSGLFLVPIEALDEVARELPKVMTVPVDFGPLGQMTIQFDIMVGRRWNKVPKQKTGSYMDEGLKDWAPGQPLHWL